MTVVAGGGLLSAMVALPMATPLALDAQRYGVLALMGLVQMPLATVLINSATRYLPSTDVALFYLVETALGTAWVWWLLGEAPTLSTLIGGSVVILVLVLHALARPAHRTAATAAVPGSVQQVSSQDQGKFNETAR